MKKIILTILILSPLTSSILHHPQPARPVFDRLANQRRVLELREMIREADLARKPMEKMPKQPNFFPMDPDSATGRSN